MFMYVFFFNDTATTEIYTLSLHDALPISREALAGDFLNGMSRQAFAIAHDVSSYSFAALARGARPLRSEEHTSELQSQFHLVCRLLLEKKKIATTSPLYVRV